MCWVKESPAFQASEDPVRTSLWSLFVLGRSGEREAWLPSQIDGNINSMRFSFKTVLFTVDSPMPRKLPGTE